MKIKDTKLIYCALAAGALSGQLYAAPVLEEIVVTAQKRSESVNDVPIAISAFTGNRLNELGVTDTRDLGNLIPGLTYSDSGYSTPIYTLRGIGFNDATYNATSTVGIYVDEVNLPYAVMSKGANLDIERVEVLKGPQGILYGRNTTGGLINYVSNKPSQEFEAGISAGYSSYNTYESEGYISGPLTDNLAGRLAVRGIYSDKGWQYSLTRPNDELGEKNKFSYRGALEWSPAETLEMRLVAEGWRDKSDPQAPQPIGVVPQNATIGAAAISPSISSHPLVDADTDDNRVADWDPAFEWQLNQYFDQVSLKTRWDFSADSALTLILSHGEVGDDSSYLPQSGYSVSNAEQILDASIKTTALEARIDGIWGNDIDWMIGGNISHDEGFEGHTLFVDTNSALYPVLGNNLIGSRIYTYGDFNADQYAIFANTSWQLSSTFKLDAGARYTIDERSFEGCSTEPNDSTGVGITALFSAVAATRGSINLIQKNECVTLDENGGNDVVKNSLNENNVSSRIALNWTPADDILIYLSASRGFKSGGFPVLSSSDQAQYAAVKQEELLAYELGAKNTLWDKRIQLNSALFYYDYRDKQLLTRILDPIFGPLPVLQNAPKSKVQGVEMDMTVTPFEGLLMSLAASYIETEIEEFESTGFDGQPTNFAGLPFNFSPELEYTFLVDYSFPISSNIELGFAADYSYTGETNSTLDQNPLFAHDSYNLINARIRLASLDERWKITLFGQNLTDELSTVSIIQAGDGAARYTGMTRVYGVSANYNFF